MPRLRNLAEEIRAFAAINAKKLHGASLFVKLVLITGGGVVAAIAQGIELAHANHEISAWTVAGLAGAVIVAIGAVFVAWTEMDVATLLESANKAIDEARLFERQKTDFETELSKLNHNVRRGLELYNSMGVMRAAIEES